MRRKHVRAAVHEGGEWQQMEFSIGNDHEVFVGRVFLDRRQHVMEYRLRERRVCLLGVYFFPVLFYLRFNGLS